MSNLLDSKTVKLFTHNWSEATRTANRLVSSVERLSQTFPISGKQLENADNDLLDKLDAFRVRFADIQDIIGNKLFRGILLLEEEQPGSMIDTLQKMEKRGILQSAEEWRALREIRNTFSHDYPESVQERAEALSQAFIFSATMLAILKSIHHYLQRYKLELDEVPDET